MGKNNSKQNKEKHFLYPFIILDPGFDRKENIILSCKMSVSKILKFWNNNFVKSCPNWISFKDYEFLKSYLYFSKNLKKISGNK